MAAISTKGGEVLNKYVLAKILAFDDSASDAAAACIAKGWGEVRRGPPLLIGSDACIIGAMSISPDNTMLAVGTNWSDPNGFCESEVVLYDTRTGKLRFQLLPRHRERNVVRCISFSPDGAAIAVGSSIGLELYDAATGELRRRIMGGDVYFAQIGSNGMVLACGNGESTLFEPLTGAGGSTYQRRWRFVHRSSTATASFSPDSRMLAVDGYRNFVSLRILDTVTHALRRLALNHMCDTVAFSPDGATIAVGHQNVVGLYDCATGGLQREHVLERDNHHVLTVAFSSAGRLLFTAQFELLEIHCYATDDGILQRELDLFGLGKLGHGNYKSEFSKDGSLLAVVGNNYIALCDVATGKRRLGPRQTTSIA